MIISEKLMKLKCKILFGGGRGHATACGILVPRPGIEPQPPAVEAQSPNQWTAREFP